MAAPDENGMVEYRVKFPATINSRLAKLADLENRSIPLMIRQLVYEALGDRHWARKKPLIIESIIRGEDV